VTKPRHSNFDCNPGCSVEATISLIDGKWKCVVLYHLLESSGNLGDSVFDIID
jgi:DNA-binding HxlR family transcriptional regulator